MAASFYLDIGNHPMSYYSVEGAFDYQQAITFAVMAALYLGPQLFFAGLMLYGLGYVLVFGFQSLVKPQVRERMSRAGGWLVVLTAVQLLFLQSDVLAAQAPSEGAAQRACMSQQAQDLLHVLDAKEELDSVLELLNERRIKYSVSDLTRPYFPNSDLQRLRQEGAKYQLFIVGERRGIYFISSDVITLDFEGSKLIMRSCREVLTGP